MLLLTGAAGFIGSCFLTDHIKTGKKVIIVDDFQRPDKWSNFQHKAFHQKIERDQLFHYLDQEKPAIESVLHLGARTNTTEFDQKIFDRLNLNYSKKIWEYCSQQQIPLIYASSAATYGNGEKGFDDNHEIVEQLEPLNPYGDSKNEFDKWVLKQNQRPPHWIGLKFFNVYGPNEYHKGRMASIVWHAYHQIKKTGKVRLFKSYKDAFKHGEQKRDFIYIKDLLKIVKFLENPKNPSGLYNIGTGKATTYNELITSIFESLNLSVNIEYIEMPQDLKNTYQYYTQANIKKLQKTGYQESFYTTKDSVKDYVTHFLEQSQKVY